MKHIVLLNVYGTKNIGDEAIYHSALELLSGALDHGSIDSIGVEIRQPHLVGKVRVNYLVSPYGTAITQGNAKVSGLIKIFHFIRLILVSWLVVGLAAITKNQIALGKDYEYINSLKRADFIVNMGGGYLRTKTRISDFFGLGLTLLPIFIAKVYRKPLLFLPMSFGNFADSIHKQLSFMAIKDSIFFARDTVTYDEVAGLIERTRPKLDLQHLPDLALLMKSPIKPVSLSVKKRSKYFVVSAREWLDSDRQAVYEAELVKAIDTICHQSGKKAVFLAMAANSEEDDDRLVYRRLKKALKNPNCLSLSPASDPIGVMNLLNRAQFAICTRMHSAILASMVLTPFVTIQYEHKTLGFMTALGLAKYNLEISQVTASKLLRLNDKLQAEYDQLHILLTSKRRGFEKQRQTMFVKLKRFLQ